MLSAYQEAPVFLSCSTDCKVNSSSNHVGTTYRIVRMRFNRRSMKFVISAFFHVETWYTPTGDAADDADLGSLGIFGV